MNNIKRFLFLISLSILNGGTVAQGAFPPADSLRGSLRPARTCFDVTYYNLDIEVDIPKKSIQGTNEVYFTILEDTEELQIDLFQNMAVESIMMDGDPCNFERIHDAIFISTDPLQKGEKGKLTITYSGKPRIAKMPPWDGGFVWKTDQHGQPWVGVACEGIGASLWWPNKDHLSDEPDSMRIHVTVPDDLFCVANGNLRKIIAPAEGKLKYSWHVQYPINNYNVSINIADYAHFSDTYVSKDGDSLDLSYYVLRDNLEKARKHFRQVHGVLEAFEYYFGKYPFWEDGYSLVETPYLGMEHQSAIAYGNNYQRGYMGGMIPREFDFDYIIVHETGHEYWGNCISAPDMAEMWIHESFTTYMESLYVEFWHGKEAAENYLRFQKFFIQNKEPVMGPPGVNYYHYGSSDHYYKGAWILHTLRNAINDDDKWFMMLRELYQQNACSVTGTDNIVNYFEEHTDFSATRFFDHYLKESKVPVLKYQFTEKGKKKYISMYFDQVAEGFELPVYVSDGTRTIRLFATSQVQEFELPYRDLQDVELREEKGYYKTRATTIRGKIK